MAEEEVPTPNVNDLSEDESTEVLSPRSKMKQALKTADENVKLNYYYTLVILHPNDIRKLLMLGD